MPDEATSELLVSPERFYLGELTRKKVAETRVARWTGAVVGGLGLLGGVVLTYSFLTRHIVVPSVVVGGLALMCLTFGVFFSVVVAYQSLNPGYDAIVIDSLGITFTEFRTHQPRRLVWTDEGFRLRLVRDGWKEMVSGCLDYTDSWAPRVISPEALEAIVAASGRAHLRVKERKGWSGLRSYFEISGAGA